MRQITFPQNPESLSVLLKIICHRSSQSFKRFTGLRPIKFLPVVIIDLTHGTWLASPAHVDRKYRQIHEVLGHHVVKHWGHPSNSQWRVSQAQNPIKLCIHKSLARLLDTLSKLLAVHSQPFHLKGELHKGSLDEVLRFLGPCSNES